VLDNLGNVNNCITVQPPPVDSGSTSALFDHASSVATDAAGALDRRRVESTVDPYSGGGGACGQSSYGQVVPAREELVVHHSASLLLPPQLRLLLPHHHGDTSTMPLGVQVAICLQDASPSTPLANNTTPAHLPPGEETSTLGRPTELLSSEHIQAARLFISGAGRGYPCEPTPPTGTPAQDAPFFSWVRDLGRVFVSEWRLSLLYDCKKTHPAHRSNSLIVIFINQLYYHSSSLFYDGIADCEPVRFPAQMNHVFVHPGGEVAVLAMAHRYKDRSITQFLYKPAGPSGRPAAPAFHRLHGQGQSGHGGSGGVGVKEALDAAQQGGLPDAPPVHSVLQSVRISGTQRLVSSSTKTCSRTSLASVRPNLVPCFNLVLPSLEPPAHIFRALESCWHAGEGLPCCPVTSCGSSGAANGRADEEYQVRARYQVRANPLLPVLARTLAVASAYSGCWFLVVGRRGTQTTDAS